VFGPMTALQGCNIGAIFDDEQWKVIGMALINEAWLIIRHDLPGAISREVVTKWVTGEIREKSGCAHSMLTDMMEGHNTDAEAANGWFVKSGKLHTPPVHCHMHQAVIDQVKARTLQVRRQLMLQEGEGKAKAERRGESRFNESDTKLDDNHEKLDKLEAKRMKKERRQEELLGNQPMPDRYSDPSISPLGNSKIRRQ